MGTWHYVDSHCRRNVEIVRHHNCIQHLCCTRKMIQLLQGWDTDVWNGIGFSNGISYVLYWKMTEEREKVIQEW
ncbi:hypothetical protein ACSBR1_040247 [Camellia fascicularis]